VLPVSANNATDIVRELRSQGYQQGVDFDFAYHQSRWDDMTGEVPKHTKFTFYNNVLSSWFLLKYQL
jgi:hypothetical protein